MSLATDRRGSATMAAARRPSRRLITMGVQKWAEGSCRIRAGRHRGPVRRDDRGSRPPHLRGKGTGWVTAEYSMLPRATAERSEREAVKGRLGGRTHEIQRLIGRSLRGIVDTTKLGERTVTVDCDVLQADAQGGLSLRQDHARANDREAQAEGFGGPSGGLPGDAHLGHEVRSGGAGLGEFLVLGRPVIADGGGLDEGLRLHGAREMGTATRFWVPTTRLSRIFALTSGVHR